MDIAAYEALVRRSLEHGVPSEVVSEVFSLPPDLCKEMRREVLVAEYGTADQAEYLEHLQWRTLKRAGQIIDHGSVADANRVAGAVLGRQIAAAGKRPSEGTREAIDDLMDHMKGIRESPSKATPPGRFVVGVGARSDGADEDDA